MKVKTVCVATIQLLVDEQDPDAAADGISAILTDGCAPDEGFLIDWAYLKIGGHRMDPTQKLITVPYEDGDFVER